ncbi:MAG: hypothetical protein U0794_22845 [Isosphaeraceae bacterium]
MTKPTREQEQACAKLVEAILLVTEAARLDGKAPFGSAELNELVEWLTRATSVFGLDQIVARALEARGRKLGLRTGTGELLCLIEQDLPPLEFLLLNDDAFRAKVDAAEAELG